MADRVPATALGQRLTFQEQTWTVVALAGARATLQGLSGQETAVLVTHPLAADNGFAVLDEPVPVPVRSGRTRAGRPRSGGA